MVADEMMPSRTFLVQQATLNALADWGFEKLPLRQNAKTLHSWYRVAGFLPSDFVEQVKRHYAILVNRQWGLT